MTEDDFRKGLEYLETTWDEWKEVSYNPHSYIGAPGLAMAIVRGIHWDSIGDTLYKKWNDLQVKAFSYRQDIPNDTLEKLFFPDSQYGIGITKEVLQREFEKRNKKEGK